MYVIYIYICDIYICMCVYMCWAGELLVHPSSILVDFEAVAILPSRASFSTTFPEKCGNSEGLETATCPKTEAGGKQGQASCKMLPLQQSLSMCQLNFMEIIRLSRH